MFQRSPFLLSLFLLCSAFAAEAQEPERPVFLVTDVVVDTGIDIDKDAARDALANRFGRLRDRIEVRSLSEVKSTLDQAALAQMLGTSSTDDDLNKISSYMTVDRLVFGRIHSVAGVTEVQVKIFNTKEGTTEIALSRRLKSGAPPQLVLTLLDSLADGLLSFAVDAYTDGEADEKFKALQAKKIEKRPALAAAPAQPWSMLGVVGGAVAGAGVTVASLGGVAFANESDQGPMLLGVGATAVVVGTTLVIVDGLSE